jgi:putative transposase
MLGGCIRYRCATASSPLSFATSAEPIRTDRAAGRSPPNKPPSVGQVGRLTRSSDVSKPGGLRDSHGSRERAGSTPWSGPSDRDGCRWDSTAGEHRLYLQGVGHIRVHQHREVRGRVKIISVKRDNQRWYVLLSCDDVPPEPLERTGSVVGIDLGVKSFLTTSDGVHVPNPRHHEHSASRLAAAQRALARCRRGSTRRQRARAQVAGLHGKVRRQRLDHAHKIALDLVRRHDVICHEALRIGNMSRSARGTMAKPGRNVPRPA